MNSNGNAISHIYANIPNNEIKSTTLATIPTNTSIIAHPPNSKWKFCLMHLLICSVISIILFINFISTVDNFKDNRILTMSSELICNKFIKEHNDCLNKHRNKTQPREIIDDCAGSSLRLQTCYDKVKVYNMKCSLYLSEFEKCVRDNFKKSEELKFLREKCKDEVSEIQFCISEYMTLDPFILLDYEYK